MTLDELAAWRVETEALLRETVSRDMQPTALRAVTDEFSTHEARIVAVATMPMELASPPALRVLHDNPGGFSSDDDLSK